jgi:hypothetical protein
MSTQTYKQQLLKEYEQALKDLDVYQTLESNLDWLWGSVKNLNPAMDERTQCALCQLALYYSRSALETAEVISLLNDTSLEAQARIEGVVDYLADNALQPNTPKS